MVTAFIVRCESFMLVKKLSHVENIWFSTCHSELRMSQRLAFWFIDLALRVKELLHVMPLTVA